MSGSEALLLPTKTSLRSLSALLNNSGSFFFVDYDFDDEADFRLQLNASAMATEKLAEGIRGFVADQIKLESLLGERIRRLA